VCFLIIRNRRTGWFDDWRESRGNNSSSEDTSDDDNASVEDDTEVSEQSDDLWSEDVAEDAFEDNSVEDVAEEDPVEEEEDEEVSEDAPSIPASPTNLRFATISPVGTVTLIWIDNSDNEEGFRIQIQGGSATTTEPDVTTVTYPYEPACGEKFSFRVNAFNADGKSEYSNVASLDGRCP